MAEQDQPVAADTPKKRKRKSELEKLLEDEQSQANASTSETDENPWTPRENLELLRIHRDYHNSGNAKQWATRLHDMMSRIRRTAFQPELPARTDKEFMSQVRQLKNEDVTVDDLEAELFPEEGTPRKKKKKKKKAPK